MSSDYITIFSPVPWNEVGISFFQAFVIYWVVLLGMRMVGRRTFGQMGPQEMILLLIISEATDLGVTHGDAGFWGSVASIAALLLTVLLVDKVSCLEKLLEGNAVTLMENGRYNQELLKKHRIQMDDLEKVSRKYGVPLEAFDCLILEGDGEISGVVKREYFTECVPK